MTLTLLVALLVCLATWRLSRAPGVAYLLYYLAFLPFLTLDPEAAGATSLADLAHGGSAVKAALRALTSLGFVVLLVRRRGWLTRLAAPAHWPVLLLVLWALASLTRAPHPALAGIRLGEMLSFFLAGVCLHVEGDRNHDPSDVLRWRSLALVPPCLMVVLAALLRPELMAFHEGPGGVRLGHRFLEANVLGFVACTLNLWATFTLREPRRRTRSHLAERGPVWLLFALALAVLVFARSRTAMVTWVLGQAALWFTFGRRDLGRQLAAAAVVALVGLGLAIGFDLVADWFLRGGSLEGLKSATGRTDLWAALVREEFARDPLFGAGYLALGPDGTFHFDGRDWSNAHNTYVFALVSMGIPGLLLLLAVTWMPLGCCVQRAFGGARLDRAWALLLVLQGTIAVTGLTGFGTCGHPNVVMLFSIALYPFCTGGAFLMGRTRTETGRGPSPPSTVGRHVACA